MVSSIYAALVVFPGTEEEEERDTGEVTDGNFHWGGALGGCVQGSYDVDWERTHWSFKIIFLLIGCYMESHTKVEFFSCNCGSYFFPQRMQILD